MVRDSRGGSCDELLPFKSWRRCRNPIPLFIPSESKGGRLMENPGDAVASLLLERSVKEEFSWDEVPMVRDARGGNAVFMLKRERVATR